MGTSLHPGLVYGPVMSRRLGVSLGMNLSPATGKVCTFDCLYCECGLNAERRTQEPCPSAEALAQALRRKLGEMAAEGLVPDSITMAGNGEPTANPAFAEVVDATLALRDELCPKAKVSVLTNATLLGRPQVRAAAERLDHCIAKLDTVDDAYITLLDRPAAAYRAAGVVETLAAMSAGGAHVSIQTMLLSGSWQGHDLDNTGERHVGPWLEALTRISPEQVMIYTIDRPTPVAGLAKASPEALDAIATRVRSLGLPCSVAY